MVGILPPMCSVRPPPRKTGDSLGFSFDGFIQYSIISAVSWHPLDTVIHLLSQSPLPTPVPNLTSQAWCILLGPVWLFSRCSEHTHIFYTICPWPCSFFSLHGILDQGHTLPSFPSYFTVNVLITPASHTEILWRRYNCLYFCCSQFIVRKAEAQPWQFTFLQPMSL